MDFKEHIRSLAILGKMEQAITEFRNVATDNDLRNSLLNLLGRHNRVNTRERDEIGTIGSINSERNKIQIALFQYLDEFNVPANLQSEEAAFTKRNIPGAVDHVDVPPDAREVKKKVFLSYRHDDSEVALKVKAFLEDNGLEVLIDVEQLGAGGNITDFIKKMIRKSDATLSLVSTESLSSPWVSKESDLTLQAEEFQDGTKFFTCSIDNEFFGDEFTNDRIKEGLAKIKVLNKEKEERLELLGPMANTDDLDSKIKRYQEYFGSLPNIVDRLNNFLTVDISGDKFEPGLMHVINSIKE
ncbi:MAG: TIR domain-containing protein [Bacteroidota bacterium]